jgi:ankyrin repeat protein
LALLVQAGADIEAPDGLDRRPLSRAAAAGNTEVVAFLLDHGAEIDGRNGIYHRTALIEAAYLGRLDSARLLLQRGADINARDDRGKSALWYAATPESYSPAGGPQLLEFLAKNGADLEAADNTGTTPLAWAKKSSGRNETYREIAKVLVRLGAVN